MNKMSAESLRKKEKGEEREVEQKENEVKKPNSVDLPIFFSEGRRVGVSDFIH